MSLPTRKTQKYYAESGSFPDSKDTSSPSDKSHTAGDNTHSTNRTSSLQSLPSGYAQQNYSSYHKPEKPFPVAGANTRSFSFDPTNSQPRQPDAIFSENPFPQFGQSSQQHLEQLHSYQNISTSKSQQLPLAPQGYQVYHKDPTQKQQNTMGTVVNDQAYSYYHGKDPQIFPVSQPPINTPQINIQKGSGMNFISAPQIMEGMPSGYQSGAAVTNLVSSNACNIQQGTAEMTGLANCPADINYMGISNLAYELSQKIPIPPYANIQPSPESLKVEHTKRNRRKSKFTEEQDKMIVDMKKAGKSWVDIAEASGVGTYLAARNRYQVLIGQQGGVNSDSGPDDVLQLRDILDEGEVEKWQYLAREFIKAKGQDVSPEQVREFIRYLFWKNPALFDVDESYLSELMKLQHGPKSKAHDIQQQHHQQQHHQQQQQQQPMPSTLNYPQQGMQMQLGQTLQQYFQPSLYPTYAQPQSYVLQPQNQIYSPASQTQQHMLPLPRQNIPPRQLQMDSPARTSHEQVPPSWPPVGIPQQQEQSQSQVSQEEQGPIQQEKSGSDKDTERP